MFGRKGKPPLTAAEAGDDGEAARLARVPAKRARREGPLITTGPYRTSRSAAHRWPRLTALVCTTAYVSRSAAIDAS